MRLLPAVLFVPLLTITAGARADDNAPQAPAPDAGSELANSPAAAEPAAAEKREEGPREPANESDFRGFQLGLRTGYARTLNSTEPESLASGTPSLLPLLIDAGYRTSPKVYLGLTVQLALASRTDCGGNGPCSAKDYRFGADIQYHFSPFATVDPWFGAGVGYEIMHLSGFVGDTGGHLTRKGLVLLDGQFGVDFPLTRGPRMARGPKLGPFVGLAIGARSSETGRVYGSDVDRSGGAGHEWAMLGVRGTYDL
jgi:hypothetical protein